MIKSESTANLVKALLSAKRNFAPVLKKSENPGFKRNGKASKYADLETAISATEQSLLDNGLVVSQFPVNEDARVGVLTLILHESGEFLGREFTLPLGKQDAQTGVAAVTYARRTGYLAALGIAAEDDDGNTAAARNDVVYDDEPVYEEPAPAPQRKSTGTRPTPKGAEHFEVEYQTDSVPATLPAHSGTTLKVTRPPQAEIPEPNEWLEPAAEQAEIPQNGKPEKATKAPKLENPSLPATGAVPTEEELDKYRARAVELYPKLADAGLKPSRGMSISQKVLKYLLGITSAADATKITVNQWNGFFALTDKLAASKQGLTQLVDLINKAAKGEK